MNPSILPFIRRSLPFVMALNLILAFLSCNSSDPFSEFLEKEGPSFDLLLEHGKVLDGTGENAFSADVLIRNDSIVFIGEVKADLIEVETVIDAAGKYITPGFIDAHAHGDPLQTPAFENFLAMGVTSICLGQDGGSPAFADLRPWMQQVDSAMTGPNIIPFVGHGTIRQLSGIGFSTEPDEEAMDRMESLLNSAMEAGCFGMTTGLEYTPGTYAGEDELLRLARIVGQYDGLIMSHMRNEDNDAVENSLRELLRQGQYCNVQASHLKAVYGRGPERAEEILALLDSARQASEYTVTADIYPYTASYTGIGIVFPQWAKAPNNYQEVKETRREELLEFLRQKITARNGPEATLFGTAPFAGKTLAEVSNEREQPFEEVLLEIGPGGASGAYFVMNEPLQARLLEDPHIMICSDGSPSMHHPRGYGSFAKIIEQYVQEEKRLSLAEAVRKMSGLTAETLGLEDRGLIKAGYYADLLIFDPEAVKARADFSEPHQLATGMDYVIVNGKVAFENGQMGARNGRMLRKNQ
jgi:N-acyl-D-aspartate/D-glutamate deacylase